VPLHQDLEFLAVIWPTAQDQQLKNLLKHELTKGQQHRRLRVATHSTRFCVRLGVRTVVKPPDPVFAPFTIIRAALGVLAPSTLRNNPADYVVTL
jgi:hypothetical protein